MTARPPLRGDRTFRDEVVRISELTVQGSLIEGYEFSNCRIIGPAVLAPLDNVAFNECTFDAPGPNAVFWEVPPDRGPVVGAVGLKNCTFSNCFLEAIGIAGPPEIRHLFDALSND